MASAPSICSALTVSLSEPSEIYPIASGLPETEVIITEVEFVISAVVGVFAIAVTRALMKADKWIYFSYYCVIAGVLVILLSIIL